MKHNMGTVDRIIRGVVAVFLGYLIFSNAVSGVLAIVLGVVALAMIATAIFAYCPPYDLLGIKTCRCPDHGDDKSAEA